MLSSNLSGRRENRDVFPFLVRSDSGDVKLTIFDSLNTEVASGDGEVSLELPAGLYVVRTESGGQLKQSTVLHKGPTDLIESMPIYSAAPLLNAVTSHEYYIGPSVRFSKETTSDPIGNGPHSSRLLLFIRCANQSGSKQEDLARELMLIDSSEHHFTTFESGTQQDRHYGWLAFSARATPGFYRLRFFGREGRLVPIHLFKDWEHQVFLTYSGRPLFEGMRHFMSLPGVGFQPDDKIAKAVDTTLDSLQNRVLLPKTTRNLLLGGKFENPMLGLVGAHVLLREKEPDQPLVTKVIENLRTLLPDSPDVAALEAGAALKFRSPGPSQPIHYAPQLRAGFQAILHHSLEYPEIVPQQGEIESFATDLLLDSPWTSWHPRRFAEENMIYGLNESQSLQRKMLDLIGPSPHGTGVEFIELHPVLQDLDWSEVYVLRAIAQAKHASRALSIPDLASNLGLPLNAVKRIVTRVENLALRDVSRILHQLPEYHRDDPARVEVVREAGPAFQAPHVTL